MKNNPLSYLEEEGVDEELGTDHFPDVGKMDKNFRKYMTEYQFYPDEEIGDVSRKIRSLFDNEEDL